MKRFTLFATVICGLFASQSNAQIALSRHNFSSYGWSRGEICLPCHTPHNANSAAGALWNHALTTATYQMFGGTTGTAVSNIDSRSRLCLGCHDGTVALDSFGGTVGTNFIGPAGNLGTDLTNDHPIGSSAVYPLSGTSTRFQPTDSTGTRVGTSPTQVRLRSWTDTGGVVRQVVGCSTCHDQHNAGNFPHMLKFSNASSQLCLTCHIK